MMNRIFPLLGLALLSASALSQKPVWQSAPFPFGAPPDSAAYQVVQFASFQANPQALRQELASAPLENPSGKGTLIWMPSPNGTLQRFRLVESPIQSPEVARQTGVKTYAAQGVDDRWATGRFDLGINGFHGMVLSPSGDYFIQPLTLGEKVNHIAFFKSDAAPVGAFRCDFKDQRWKFENPLDPTPLRPGPNRKDSRMALKGTGEYTVYYGGVAQADNGSITIMNRVNGIYERDIAIRMVIVTLTNFPNAATDPYNNIPGTTMLNQNQAECDANPGNANYDIGHVFCTGGGGIAGLQVVGVTGAKARGISGLPQPIGDVFAVDYVSHEIGHQWGANHTFNGTTGACGGGNRSSGNAYEPGSGSTIMAYAGICGSENVQNFSDDYFHINSMSAMEAWRNNAGSGGSLINTGNSSPSVNAGLDYTIPRDTPFRLTATASDPNGDPLTYCWEQYNLGTATPSGDESTRPLFRSRKPVTSGTRWLPMPTTVINNWFDQWENLPSVDRSMTFRCTVRDNRAGGGNFEWDAMNITVSGVPFQVTSPNTAVSWTGGTNQTINWNVGGGSVAASVRILLSTDGGNSYFNGTATVLLSSTPNDGSQVVTLPNISTNQARIIVEPVGNIFYDMSDVNFTITPGAQIVNPDGYSIIMGSEPAHNLAALLQSDDVRLSVSGPLNLNYVNMMELHAICPVSSVTRLSFILENHSFVADRFREIQLFNYVSGAWEVVSTTPVSSTDTTVKVDITSNPNRFIRSGTRDLLARVRMFNNPVSRNTRIAWDHHDRAVWEILP
jgi:hypothetical protein